MNSLFFKKLLVFSLLLIPLVAATLSASAQSSEPDLNVPDVFQAKGDPMVVATRLIRYVLGFVGMLALIMIIYGGFLWMTSGGNEEKIKKGKNTLVWAVLGLALVLFSYSIINYIFKVIIEVSNGGNANRP